MPAAVALPILPILADESAVPLVSTARAAEPLRPARGDQCSVALLLRPVLVHEFRHRQTLLKLSPFGIMAPGVSAVMAPLETMDFGVRTGSRMRDFSSFCNVRF